jgi:hypothetical protein
LQIAPIDSIFDGLRLRSGPGRNYVPKGAFRPDESGDLPENQVKKEDVVNI